MSTAAQTAIHKGTDDDDYDDDDDDDDDNNNDDNNDDSDGDDQYDNYYKDSYDDPYAHNNCLYIMKLDNVTIASVQNSQHLQTCWYPFPYIHHGQLL